MKCMENLMKDCAIEVKVSDRQINAIYVYESMAMLVGWWARNERVLLL